MPSPILARADALMQRRRQNSAESDEIPVLTDALDDDDIPILLIAEPPPAIPEATVEVLAEPRPAIPEATIGVPAEPQPASAPPAELPLPPAIDTAQRDALIRELAHRVEQRLLAELPRLIESTVCDFLAEQQANEKPLPHA